METRENTVNDELSLAASVRQCRYDPTKDYIRVKYRENDVEELYLEVKYRVFWFNQYCLENNIKGVIDESDVSINPDMNLVVAKVKIFMDNELIAAACAGAVYIPGPENAEHNAKIIQTAATSAKGRALANAGFGSITGCKAENGDLFPVDSGIVITRDEINPMLFHKTRDPFTSQEPNKEPEYVPADMPEEDIQQVQESKPAAKSKAAAPAKTEPDTAAPKMTLEEAYDTIVPVGKLKGSTVGEMAATNMSFLEWCASSAFDTKNRYPEFKQAVQLVLQKVSEGK